MRMVQQVGRFTILTVVLAALGVCLSSRAAPADTDARKNTKYPQHILLIRHAEKTGDTDDVHLSKQGQERAEVLEKLFVATKNRPEPFPTPDFIFAACHHKDSQRPIETVTPLAKKLKLTVNDNFDSKLPAPDKKDDMKKAGAAELRDELFGSTKYYGKTILVSWRHSTLPDLARTLKANKVPEKWEDKVFDRVWQIDYDDQGNTTFRDLPQRLLPGDSEK
jgi:hypothetical protein